MDYTISVQMLVNIGCGIMGLWGFIKVIKEIRSESNKEHDKRQRWDKTADIIEKKEEFWDKGLADMEQGRIDIVKRYDERLDEIEERIDENHTDTEAKIQEVRSEILLLTECMRAVLDGLHQLDCNGKVTEASNKLDSYLVGLVGK